MGAVINTINREKLMEAIVIIVIALIAGLVARLMSMPPMVGFLAAGFALNPLESFLPGISSINLQPLSDIGVTLLLFTIGLKLDLRSLIRPFVWGVASLHMVLVTALIVVAISGLKLMGWSFLDSLSISQSLTIGFALSFSSTVFAVKVLEQQGEVASLHGKIAIGILVMQDILAVFYLSMMGGGMPSPYALLLLLFIPMRQWLVLILKKCGHNELLALAGFALAYGAYGLFELVNLKGGLGALFVGAILAGTAKGSELAKTLFMLKDLLLIGFFLSIGQYGLPSGDAWMMALVMAVLLLIKPILYFLLMTRFRLRVQTALSGSLALNNYSEFGLIVLAIAASEGVLSGEWLVILALALSFSFVICSIVNLYAEQLYQSLSNVLDKMQTEARVLEQQPISIGNAEILVMGMGRLGTGAYDYLHDAYGDVLIGFEEDAIKTKRHLKEGRNVLVGDASDRDLWQRLPHCQVKKIILALSNHAETVKVTKMLRDCGYEGSIAAVAKFEDHLQELKEMGVIAFNFYAEAGAGFAEHVVNNMKEA